MNQSFATNMQLVGAVHPEAESSLTSSIGYDSLAKPAVLTATPPDNAEVEEVDNSATATSENYEVCLVYELCGFHE